MHDPVCLWDKATKATCCWRLSLRFSLAASSLLFVSSGDHRKSRDPTLGRREAAEFRLAHLVALQLAIPGGDGIHRRQKPQRKSSVTEEKRTRFLRSSRGGNEVGLCTADCVGFHSEHSETATYRTKSARPGFQPLISFAAIRKRIVRDVSLRST